MLKIFTKIIIILLFLSCNPAPVETKTSSTDIETGQIKFYSGGYNGSIFWFSPRVLMTNEHVISKHSKDDIEYIALPRIVFYKKDRQQEVKKYIQKRLERENSYIAQGKDILSQRIKNLQQKTSRTAREENILQSYIRDQELLNTYEPLSLGDKVFIALDDAIEKFWTPQKKDAPDIALVTLKKPIQELLKGAGSSLKLNDKYFAENNLYDPAKHGWIYEGTTHIFCRLWQKTSGKSLR